MKRKRQSVLPENINKIALSPKDDKKIWSINSVETYAYGTGKNLIYKKNQKTKCNNIIKQCKNWLA